MFPIPSNEILIENKICKQCYVSFPITDKDLEFYDKVSPVFAGKKYQIPTPTLCPDCRQQRRLSFRNERKLYKRKCDATGKDIISIYSPESTQKVYDQSYWWSDKWNPMDYGRDFDFSRGFFEQFDEFTRKIPLPSILNINSENSIYSQGVELKNCYYTFTGGINENTHHSNWMIKSQDSIDCMRCSDISHCYDCLHCYEFCSNLRSCNHCYNSSSCSYCWNLRGCEHCYMSGNLSNAKYVWYGEQLEKEEYMKRLAELRPTDESKRYTEWKSYMSHSVFPENWNFDCDNTTGNLNNHTKNCQNCYEINDSSDCRYFFDNAGNCHDCMDCTYGRDGTKCYETLVTGGHNSAWNIFSWPNVENLYYSIWCGKSQNCFGCVGLQGGYYCILNKQYTKEEYEILVPRIIEHMISRGEWGEFFPSSLSPFGYNETLANEYFALTREETIEANFNWSDYESPFPKVEKIIPAAKLPEDITQIPDDILNWAIECEVTKKPFRIISQELEFYRKHNISIPRRHPDQRHEDRMKMKNPRKLWERKCDCCNKDISTSYPINKPETVYCEGCYLEII